MIATRLGQRHWLVALQWVIWFWVLMTGGAVHADDFVLILGGGYNPTGNQASLEENVLFFQQLLKEKHTGAYHSEIYFADGDDPTPDLQVMAAEPARTKLPAFTLLASLHRRRGQEDVEYRNHRIRNVAGPLDPALIRSAFKRINESFRPGDRLIVYVAAHGSEGPESDEYDTTIDCWNEKSITAREFNSWLNELPRELPVVMVMAQCYSGGFARSIFRDLRQSEGLVPFLRVGFFVQQHDLPAAGCRPDIEHDDEFSSYFWGAVAGRMRNGKPIEGCDLNDDGMISFAEAYAYAFWASETIDIPLKTSDVFLRAYSRMSSELGDRDQLTRPGSGSQLAGSLQSYVDRGSPLTAKIVKELSRKLEFSLDQNVVGIVKAYEDHRKKVPGEGRERNNRRGSRTVRRDLLKEITEKWPELGDSRHWEESSLLKEDAQEKLMEELKELPSFAAYDERRRQMESIGDDLEKHELQEVKFRRLIKTLELIVLEKNLAAVAKPEIVRRYQQMIDLEQSPFSTSQKAAR